MCPYTQTDGYYNKRASYRQRSDWFKVLAGDPKVFSVEEARSGHL